MTSVFSGGLVYEYSQEGNGYGLVTISGDSVTTDSGFTYLQTALANASTPTGNGGATTTSNTSSCPPESSNWDVSNDDVPTMPSAAEVYLKDGAGTGPGLTGLGSQNSGNTSDESSASTTGGTLPSQTTTATGGATLNPSTATGSSASASGTAKGAAVAVGPCGEQGVWVIGMVVLAGIGAGVALL